MMKNDAPIFAHGCSKAIDPEFRQIEGFPLGTDAAILELSDPPYYTACPNPFIEDFIKHHGRPYTPQNLISASLSRRM